MQKNFLLNERLLLFLLKWKTPNFRKNKDFLPNTILKLKLFKGLVFLKAFTRL